jgi:hypothetical protein
MNRIENKLKELETQFKQGYYEKYLVLKARVARVL